jgi:hypothetical protein
MLDKWDNVCYNTDRNKGGESGRLTLKKSPSARHESHLLKKLHYLVSKKKKEVTTYDRMDFCGSL